MLYVINRLKKAKGVTWSELSKDLPISTGGLRAAFERGSVDDFYLNHVCKILEVDMGVFSDIPKEGLAVEYLKVENTHRLILLNDALVNESQHIDISGLLRGCECAIRVNGGSMLPNYPSGCIIGLKLCTDGIIEGGNVYVIETSDNKYVKRIYKTEKGLECYSDNVVLFTEGQRKGKPLYESFIIPMEKVEKIYRVVGRIINN